MSPQHSLHNRVARRFSLVALLLACMLTPSSAGAMSSPSAEANLSSRLAELAKPAVRFAPRAEQAARLSLAARGPGSLLRDGNRILADVRFDSGAAAGVDALRAAGAEIVHVSRRYQTVTVAVRPFSLPEIGGLPRIGGVTEVLTPIVRAADCGGAVRSEGDAQLHADNARAGFAVDGSGVTVGILSDSFDRNPLAATRAAGDVASGDLPGPGSPCGSSSPVSLLDDSEAGGSDEGRAMAQIVHDLAPGASIDFASAFGSELGFAANIKTLADAGAEVIVDDVAWFGEPFFQDGPIAVAVNEVAAAGVSYFSAAGNDNLIDTGGRNIASWETPEFRDSGGCPAELLALPDFGLGHCLDFDPAAGSDDTFRIAVSPGATLTVDLQWAEPWNGVATDLDAFLLDSNDDPLVGSVDNNIVTQRPVEFLQWKNQSGTTADVQLAINNCFGVLCNEDAGGAAPRLKFALLQNGGGVTETEYPESSGGDVVGPTVFGHSGATGAIVSAAVRRDTTSKPESFSSRGPVKHYFGPVAGSTPAAPIGEQVIAKPDLAATDGAINTFFGISEAGSWRFYGTSAAAPHAAAVAALVRQANPGAGAVEVRSALIASAHPVGAFGPDSVGAGLVDAYGAVQALALPPTVTITKAPEPLGRNRQPTIEFSANRPVAFRCEVDGGAPQPCASPYRIPIGLGDGSHAIAVSGIDVAGRRGTAVAGFEIDTKRPRTKIAKHPPKLIRTHRRSVRARFRFVSNEPGVTFVCKFDRGLLRFCPRKISRRFGEGGHRVKVRARDRAGNVDRTPAVFRFRVERVG
jgi:hypothetical protein